MAPISLVSILRVYSGVNTHKQNRCHAPWISDYSSASKYLLAPECDVTLERYRSWQCQTYGGVDKSEKLIWIAIIKIFVNFYHYSHFFATPLISQYFFKLAILNRATCTFFIARLFLSRQHFTNSSSKAQKVVGPPVAKYVCEKAY